VIDRAAEDQAERPESDLADQQELVDRQVRGEDRPGLARLQLGQPLHGIVRNARRIQLGRDASPGGDNPPEPPRASGMNLLVGHGLSCQILILAAWRRWGSSDMMASVGPLCRCSEPANLAIAVPMVVASTMWSRRP